ncbi:MAG: NAD(P)/FAD-dependent oxidoreductase [Muribaculaceae bacterium]|nr:NAD(P)/FAD-dependent oxidoreductase [Muribaculaceae bacterium]
MKTHTNKSYSKEIILVLGGGFAGMNFAKHIDHKRYEVKVVDRNNFHSFPPLFYQVASSGLETSDISFPFRREFKKLKNITYHLGHVKNIDLKNKTVTTSYETIPYDKLVVALGSTNNFFGMEGLDEEVFCIKTAAEASRTREEILDRLERASIEPNPERRRQLLSFMIVGGGASGVEIAGALGEMKRDIIPLEYPELNPDELSITLIEGGDSLLSAMGDKCSQKAYVYLQKLLVDVRLNTHLTSYKDKMASFADGHSEYWETLIWTAGVKGESLPGFDEKAIGHAGRILTDEYCRVKGYEDSVFAIGDIALMTTDDYPHGHPQLAQPALQQGKLLAENLNLKPEKADKAKPFRYKDKGTMATVGKHLAVAKIGNLTLGGGLAWLAWMFVHLVTIMGMRNKVSVLTNWIWNYFSYSTSLRILQRPTKYPMRRHWGD